MSSPSCVWSLLNDLHWTGVKVNSGPRFISWSESDNIFVLGSDFLVELLRPSTFFFYISFIISPCLTLAT